MKFSVLLSNEEILAELGRRLAVARIRSRITQKELAAKAGISASTYRRLENGAGLGSVEAFVAVLKAQESIPAKGHSWDGGRVTQEATCTAEGVKTFTCSNCGATRTDTFPAKGHTPAAVPGRAATCTEAGLTEGSQCSACGAVLKAQETIPAKGHAWDGGVITAEPQGFTPGVKTYTCQNDPSHTYTEPVDPTQSVFNGMSNVIPDFSSGWLMNNPVGDMLHIVTQPQGGVVHTYLDHSGTLWYGYMTIYVEAAGGEGAYVYNWYREPAFAGMSTSVIADIVTAQGTAIAANVQAIQNSTTSGLSELNQAWIDQHKIPGVTIAKPSTATEMETMTMNAQPFNPCQEFLGTSADPTCNGWPGYRYWCVVEDEAGHKAVSEKAEVKKGLHIVRQPESKNIYGRDSVALTCVAAGGSGPEHQLYNWFDAAGKLLSDESTYMATTTGNYYCKVFDFGTDEVVDAEMARVYYEQIDLRPTITLQPESVILIPQEDGQYSWSMACLAQTFDGGSEDLQYDWYGKTDAGWAPIASGNVLTRSYDHGTFRCKVTDKRNGAYVSSDEAKVALIMVSEQPTVTPAFGVIAWNQHFDFNFPFKGGVAPYQVDVYQVSYTNFPGIEPVVTHYNSYVTYSRDNIMIYDAPYVHFVFIEQNGEEKKYDDYYKYYVTVTDASGQEQTSESVWYWDAETTR